VPQVIEGGAAQPAAAPASASGMITELADAKDEISVIVGRSKLVEAKRPFSRIVIANPGIADVQLLDADQPNPKLLNILGRVFGTTTLTLWDDQDTVTSYLIRVTIDSKEMMQRIRTLWPGAEVRVRQVGTQIILDGQVPDAKTMAEVLQMVTSSLLGYNIGAPQAMGAPAVSGGGGPGGAAPAGGAGTTSGAPNQSMMMSGGNQMQSTGAGVGGGGILPPGTIINRVHVPGPRQVMLHVKIAELNRTALRQIGVSWLDTRNQAILGSTVGGAGLVSGSAPGIAQSRSFIPGSFITPGVGAAATNPAGLIGTQAGRTPGIISPLSSTFGAIANAASGANSQLFGIFNAGEFNLFINALRTNQLAKVLAEPNLMALDGEPARFIAGGSFPFPVPQSTAVGGASVAVTIQFRDFGAIVQFLPHILANDVIRLDVEPSFSELNPATGVTVLGTTVPGINQRSARTVVELREGQTLAVAGLLQTRTTGSTTRVPFLGDLPVVGVLFSANNYLTTETELVVLVTPELVAPMEKNEVPPAPGDRVLEPNDYEFYFLGRIEGKTGHTFRATVAEFDPLDVMKHFQCETNWVVGPHGHSD
jgi:pilus assembly protein CpaC